MDPLPPGDPDPGVEPPDEQPVDTSLRIQTITCGRCGWPNACRVQAGMRALRFMCQWCMQMTTGIVDPTLKRNIIF